MLESLGYDVLLAANGAEALELAERHRDLIGLLLTDVMMPGMSGPEVATQITNRIVGLPVLFMSGYTGDALASVTGLQLETDLLPKPFSVNELARLTTSKLGLRRRQAR
jgi:CheY-like chemotaxis protein